MKDRIVSAVPLAHPLVWLATVGSSLWLGLAEAEFRTVVAAGAGMPSDVSATFKDHGSAVTFLLTVYDALASAPAAGILLLVLLVLLLVAVLHLLGVFLPVPREPLIVTPGGQGRVRPSALRVATRPAVALGLCGLLLVSQAVSYVPFSAPLRLEGVGSSLPPPPEAAPLLRHLGAKVDMRFYRAFFGMPVPCESGVAPSTRSAVRVFPGPCQFEAMLESYYVLARWASVTLVCLMLVTLFASDAIHSGIASRRLSMAAIVLVVVATVGHAFQWVAVSRAYGRMYVPAAVVATMTPASATFGMHWPFLAVKVLTLPEKRRERPIPEGVLAVTNYWRLDRTAADPVIRVSCQGAGEGFVTEREYTADEARVEHWGRTTVFCGVDLREILQLCDAHQDESTVKVDDGYGAVGEILKSEFEREVNASRQETQGCPGASI